ncbi:MAG: hypothetical protein E7618_00920 [Ruminococcaceae bacterium]|nr:hypothetical protein [Oscillospiraceae bacterium]
MPQQKSVKNKTPAIRFLIILGILFVSLLLLNFILDGTIARWLQPTPSTPERQPVFLYEADYDLNIFEEEEYMAEERRLLYRVGGEGVYLANKTDCLNTGDVAIFFFDYFEAIIRGNHEQYNAMFTDSYLAEYGRKDRFTMQQIYDVEMNQLREYTINEGEPDQTTVYEFRVGYRIRRNNGTFRDDLASRELRWQIYQLYQDDNTGEIKVNLISEYNIKA